MFDRIIEAQKECLQAESVVGKDLIRVLPCTREGFEVIIEQIWDNHFIVSFDG